MEQVKNEKGIELSISSKFINATKGITKLEMEASELVFNEDNVDAISEFLQAIRKIEIQVEAVHKAGKAPVLALSRQWDAAKNLFLYKTETVTKSVRPRYNELCNKIQREAAAKKAKQEARRKNLEGIERNLVAFSSRISDCVTSAELVSIERLINLEKTRKDKYGDLMDFAADQYNTLTVSITKQKELVREIEALAKSKKEVEDADQLSAIESKEEELQNQREENNIEAQSSVIDKMVSAPVYVESETVSVKARRTVWKYELKDAALAFRKRPEMLDVSLNSVKAREALNDLKESKVLEGRTEYLIDGIRFYEDKTF